MQPYIVFALARTGSTTLLQLLNCHAGLRCVFEPFNPTNVNPHLAKCVELRRQHGVEKVVRGLWEGCNGFKHVWHWDGWPMKDDPDANRRLLIGVGAKIILMHRRNRLRRAISVQISAQMQLWTPHTAEHFQRIRSHRFTALDIEKLRAEVEGLGTAMVWAREELTKHRVPWLDVAYEELFEERLSMESRMEKMRTIFEFLGVGPETAPERLEKMRELFDPAKTGFQNAEAYDRIPNIGEVEAALGSDEGGHVFDQPFAP